jgi:hypothetical protein
VTEDQEMFESAVRPNGDLAGVFEYDGETSYFYLYRTGNQGDKVLDSIHVASDAPDFTASDLEIRWTKNATRVGLFIRGDLWAVFDAEKGAKHGGDYRPKTCPALAAAIKEGF